MAIVGNFKKLGINCDGRLSSHLFRIICDPWLLTTLISSPMKKLFTAALLTASALVAIASPAKADVASETQLSKCVMNQTGKIQYSKLFPALKVYTNGANTPHSEPVILLDDFTGKETLALTDHHFEQGYFKGQIVKAGVLSSWNLVMILPTVYHNKSGFHTDQPTEMTMKVGRELFELIGLKGTGEGTFIISPELADALQRSTDVKVRLKISNGRNLDYPIGSKTIESWRSMRNGMRGYCTQP